MKRLALVLEVLWCTGCGGSGTALPDKGYTVSGQNPFRFEVSANLLREWGGYGSVRFNQVLEEELERLRICRNGYVLRNEGTRDDVFSVTGRCR
jgi:hypothetical protein